MRHAVCITWIVGAALSVGSLVGCDNKQKDELAMLKDKNSQLEEELDQKNSALEGSEASRRSLEEENARLRMSAEQGSSQAMASGDQPTLPTDLPAGVTARVEGNAVVLDIPGDVLFDSGKATVRAEAKKTLDQLAQSIKSQYPGKRISVEGFTDVDPIKKSKWSDNWELGYERARAVGKYLVSRGFSESQFRYVSYGATEPRTSKKESRRVELAIVDAN